VGEQPELLHQAVVAGNVDAVHALIKQGVWLDLPDHDGCAFWNHAMLSSQRPHTMRASRIPHRATSLRHSVFPAFSSPAGRNT
jgi:hypothetical protein